MLHSPLPWKIESVNQFERSVKDAANHNVQMTRGGIFDLSELDAKFMVEAVNSYEANQAEIEQLRAQLENVKREIAKISYRCGWYEGIGLECTSKNPHKENYCPCEICPRHTISAAIETIEKNDINESLLQK